MCCKLVFTHGINVEYMYAFIQRDRGSAVIIFRFDKVDQAVDVLKDNNFTLIPVDVLCFFFKDLFVHGAVPYRKKIAKFFFSPLFKEKTCLISMSVQDCAGTHADAVSCAQDFRRVHAPHVSRQGQ